MNITAMTARERFLALLVGGCAFVILNLWLMSTFARRSATLRENLATRKNELANINTVLAQRDSSAARDAALDAKLPKLGNENAADVQLLDEYVRPLAKRNEVTIENPVFGGLETAQWYKAVPVTLDTHALWPNLVAFLYALQKPDQFVVCESANLQVDPGDPTKMLGHFKIAHWYAR